MNNYVDKLENKKNMTLSANVLHIKNILLQNDKSLFSINETNSLCKNIDVIVFLLSSTIWMKKLGNCIPPLIVWCGLWVTKILMLCIHEMNALKYHHQGCIVWILLL